MDIQKLQYLLTKDEGPKLDFKMKLSTEMESSKKELAKDICAIANSRGGRGYIIFGIEDKTKKVIGIRRNEFSEEKIQQIVSTRLEPPVPISVDVLQLNGLDIGIISIYNTDQKPHQLRENGAFYMRRGSTTDIMRKEELASMFQDMGLISHEMLPIVRAAVSDLDRDKINEYFINSGINTSIDNAILSASGILHKERDSGEYHPTCGGMLLFGKHPYNFIPQSIIRIHNTLNSSLPYNHISRGTIMEMLNDASEFIKQCLNGINFPEEIINELIGKSVLYRDYFDVNGCVEIYLNNKYIEFSNPGAAIKGNGNNDDKYIKRNMWLYLKLLSIDSSRKYFNKNISINSIIKDYGRIKYLNILSKNIFKVVVYYSAK